MAAVQLRHDPFEAGYISIGEDGEVDAGAGRRVEAVILFKLLALPVTAPAAGIRYCLEKVLEFADQQMWDEDPVREQLILVNEAFEEGRMPEAEFREREAELLARLREIREHKKGAAQAQLSAMPEEGVREVVIELPDEMR
jgi:hypothetical protein